MFVYLWLLVSSLCSTERSHFDMSKLEKSLDCARF